MNLKRIGLLAASIAFLAAGGALADNGRSAYTYVRESTGQVTVDSSLNGEVEARRNMPIAAGDQMRTADPARAEVALADGNVLHVGGGTRVRFDSLSGQQGSDDEVSEVTLSEGSVILSVVGSDESSVPRIDTEDAAVYANSGARARVNADPRRGTSVVVRAGSVEVRTRSGSYTVRAGNYLIAQGDQEPEIARGNFSRDRFDLWAEDRLQITYDAPRSASSRYVGDDYAGDVQSLDGYGDWDYNSDYSSYVWRPRVAAGWSPYSYGSWYYTPIGLSWWSWDPWGWYPFHYGNWFFDAGWNSWCWNPGYVYSPAWVYWGYSGSYFGWCPVGWYGYYSPWWNNYYRDWHGGGHGGWHGDGHGGRGDIAFAINGRFSTRTVDVRGWNFTNAQNVGGRGRLEVLSGTRVVNRLGSDFSVSSRPIVLANRGGGNVRDALRDHIREAPRTIERTFGRDSERLAPVLAREKTLPRATVDALRDRTVVAERGRLSGPGAADMAPRGATIVDRSRGSAAIERPQGGATDRSGGRSTVIDRSPSREIERSPSRDIDRSPSRERSESGRGNVQAPAARPDSTQDWRGRSSRPAPAPDRSVDAPRSPERASPGERSAPAESWRGRSSRPAPAPDRSADAPRSPERASPGERSAPAESWRGRPRESAREFADAPARRQPVDRRGEGWRSRSEVPPARRVIEGAVPGRRGQPEFDADRSPRSRSEAPDRGYSFRDRQPGRNDAGPGPRSYDRGPAPRSYDRGPAPRSYDRGPAPRSYDRAPAPRSYDRAPAPRSAPAPAPRSYDRGPAPRSAPPQAAPAPRSAPAPSSPHSSRGSGRAGRP